MVQGHIISVFLIVLALGSTAYAQGVSDQQEGVKPKGAVVGSIDYVEANESERNPQLQSLENIQRWVASVDRISLEGGKGVPDELTPADVSYMSVAYLYCVKQQGTCPFFLETILDADLEVSRSSGVASCATLKRFWKEWLRSGLEERAKFLLSVSKGLELAAFNSQERPRYVQCSGTVAALVGPQSNLTARFGNDGASRAHHASMKQFIEQLQTDKVDVYQEIQVAVGKKD